MLFATQLKRKMTRIDEHEIDTKILSSLKIIHSFSFQSHSLLRSGSRRGSAGADPSGLRADGSATRWTRCQCTKNHVFQLILKTHDKLGSSKFLRRDFQSIHQPNFAFVKSSPKAFRGGGDNRMWHHTIRSTHLSGEPTATCFSPSTAPSSRRRRLHYKSAHLHRTQTRDGRKSINFKIKNL